MDIPHMDDVSLQEPLISFTRPARDDPGWQLLEQDANEWTESRQYHAGQMRGETLTSSISLPALENELSLVKLCENVESKDTVRTEAADGNTLQKLCKSARQPALDLESKASAFRNAAEKALSEGNWQAARDYRFQAAKFDQEAEESHRKAACTIYAANNDGLATDTIDLRNLRPQEVQAVRVLLQAEQPPLTAYHFRFNAGEHEQRIVLEKLAKELNFPYYRDGNSTTVVVRDQKDIVEASMIIDLKNQARSKRSDWH